MKQNYDIAAYIWPAYTGKEPRTRIFWPEGYGEWQSVKSAQAKYPGHCWPRKPLWGYVDEADPYVMDMEIQAAVDHGVNVFIYDWYWYDDRPFLEQCLNDGFLRAKNRDKMKFYLMWANHDARSLWDKRTASTNELIWRGDICEDQFRKNADRLIEKYFKLDCYYRIDNKPVFMIYDVNNLVRGLGGIENTRRCLEWFREHAQKKGLPGLHLQMTIWGEDAVDISGVDANHTGSTKEIVALLGFDSVTHYQFVHFTDMNREYPMILKDVENEWERIDREYSCPYFPHVSVGWDNNPRYTELLSYVTTKNTPEAFYEAMQMARRYLDKHPERPRLITINSWNEWTESSYLEPDDQYGYGYLEAINTAIKNWSTTNE